MDVRFRRAGRLEVWGTTPWLDHLINRPPSRNKVQARKIDHASVATAAMHRTINGHTVPSNTLRDAVDISSSSRSLARARYSSTSVDITRPPSLPELTNVEDKGAFLRN